MTDFLVTAAAGFGAAAMVDIGLSAAMHAAGGLLALIAQPSAAVKAENADLRAEVGWLIQENAALHQRLGLPPPAPMIHVAAPALRDAPLRGAPQDVLRDGSPRGGPPQDEAAAVLLPVVRDAGAAAPAPHHEGGAPAPEAHR